MGGGVKTGDSLLAQRPASLVGVTENRYWGRLLTCTCMLRGIKYVNMHTWAHVQRWIHIAFKPDMLPCLRSLHSSRVLACGAAQCQVVLFSVGWVFLNCIILESFKDRMFGQKALLQVWFKRTEMFTAGTCGNLHVGTAGNYLPGYWEEPASDSSRVPAAQAARWAVNIKRKGGREDLQFASHKGSLLSEK